MYSSLTSMQRDLMFACLLLANHKPKQWEWKGEVFMCNSGEFVTSTEHLRVLCSKGTTTQEVRTGLKKLKTWDFLTIKTTSTGTKISVINWDTYQNIQEDNNKDSNKPLTNEQQTNNKPVTTNKNVKNGKNVKEVNTIITYLNKILGKNYKPNAPKTIQLINARLSEGYTLDDFKKVINIKHAEWKDDSKMAKYLQPSTLFSPKFEGYLNQEVKTRTSTGQGDKYAVMEGRG